MITPYNTLKLNAVNTVNTLDGQLTSITATKLSVTSVRKSNIVFFTSIVAVGKKKKININFII